MSNKFYRDNDGLKNIRYLIAQSISHFLNPIAIAFAILLWRAWSISISFLEFILFLVAYVLVPTGCILFMFFTNKISNIYPKNRKQREKLLIVGLTAYCLGWLITYIIAIDRFLLMLASIHVLSTLVVLCINRYWRISIHCVGVAGAATLLINTSDIGIYWGLLSMIFTAWARLYLKAHSLSQVLVGLFLGTIVGFIALLNNVLEA